MIRITSMRCTKTVVTYRKHLPIIFLKLLGCLYLVLLFSYTAAAQGADKEDKITDKTLVAWHNATQEEMDVIPIKSLATSK